MSGTWESRNGTVGDNEHQKGAWDFNATKLTVYFGELPLDQEITIKLTNWYRDMKDVPPQRKPVEVKGVVGTPVKLTTGVTVVPQIEHIFVFWHGIYDKWLNAPKTHLNESEAIYITLVKTGAKKWHILRLEGESSRE